MLGCRRCRLAIAAVACAVVALATLAPLHAAAAPASAWGIAPSQDPAANDNRLYSVACADAATCWAVGWYNNGSVYQTLIERLTPTGWVVVPSPDGSSTTTTNGNEDNVLTSVTCVRAGPCFAAGYWYDGQNQAHTLITENSGSGWQPMTSADSAPAVVDDLLNGITCVSASDCWAVGESLVPGTFFIPYVPVPGTPAQTFAEHWDGSQWKIATTADSGAGENVLDGVACVSTADCVAVGIDNTGSSTYDALVEQWNGSSWSIVGSANPSAQLNELDGAWCGGDGTCHATGIQRAPSATQTLTEQANGSSGWTSDGGADTAPDRLNGSTGITCTADDDCWSVGEYDSNGQFLFQTLIQQRTARGWSVAPSADTSPTQANQLWGVACADPADCYAVGWSTDAHGVNHTLIEASTAAPVQVPEVAPGLAVPGALLAMAAGARWRAGAKRVRSVDRAGR